MRCLLISAANALMDVQAGPKSSPRTAPATASLPRRRLNVTKVARTASAPGCGGLLDVAVGLEDGGGACADVGLRGRPVADADAHGPAVAPGCRAAPAGS